MSAPCSTAPRVRVFIFHRTATSADDLFGPFRARRPHRSVDPPTAAADRPTERYIILYFAACTHDTHVCAILPLFTTRKPASGATVAGGDFTRAIRFLSAGPRVTALTFPLPPTHRFVQAPETAGVVVTSFEFCRQSRGDFFSTRRVCHVCHISIQYQSFIVTFFSIFCFYFSIELFADYFTITFIFMSVCVHRDSTICVSLLFIFIIHRQRRTYSRHYSTTEYCNKKNMAQQ